MNFHCFVGFWFFFQFWNPVLGDPQQTETFWRYFCSCQTLCCPHLVHKFPHCSEIMTKHHLFICPFAFSHCYSTKLHIRGCKYYNSLPNPKCFQRSSSFWREKAELLSPLVSSTCACCSTVSWVFHIPSSEKEYHFIFVSWNFKISDK